MQLTHSLRQKVTFGYSLVAAAILALSLFTLAEVSLLEEKVLAGERVDSLYDSVLELRRFEKNFFLYHQEEDLAQHREYLARARTLLHEHAADFAGLLPPAQLTGLGASLDEYARRMDAYAADPARPAELAAVIRENGKSLHDRAQAINRAERARLKESLAWYRNMEFLAVVALGLLTIGTGRLLYSIVARPLAEMERRMEAVAHGSTDRLTIASTDREWLSLTHAFNHVLDELEARRRHLLRTEKLASLGTLLSGVAHELNNPLSNISTSCQILLEEEQMEPEFRRELLGQIDEQTLRARNIVRSLLDFARDRAFQRESLELLPLIKETVRFLRGQVSTQVTLRVEVPAGVRVLGDKQRLQQALLNLLKNAAEALPGEGEVRVRAVRHGGERQGPAVLHRASTTCRASGEVVDIEVADSGSGIPRELLPRIFDPFFTTKEVGQGSGLGLAIVHEIIEEHDGCIAVESLPGVGTSFHIRLPAG